MSCVLGIDLGTSAVKVSLLGEHGPVGEATVGLQTQHPVPGYAEQHPGAWLEALQQALGTLRQNTGVAWSGIAAIGLSGQMHGVVALGHDQQVLRPAMLWNDQRAAPQAAQLQGDSADLAELAGVMATAAFPAAKLLWLAAHEPSTWQALRHLLMPKDYLRLWLTGELATDPVDAAGTWLFEQQSGLWSRAICQRVGLDPACLPRVLPSAAATGELRSEIAALLGLAAGLPVVAGAGDAAAGCLGLGMVADDDGFISLGTSAQVFLNTLVYKPQIASLVHTFAHALPGKWFQMAAMLNGASALAWWAGVCERTPAALLAELSSPWPVPGAPLFHPYLSGERTPHNDPQACGAFLGLRGGVERSALTGAVLEGVAFAIVDGLEALYQTRAPVPALGFTGGGARSVLWAQLLAAVTETPIVRYEDSAIGPVLGAARLAQVYLGWPEEVAFSRPEVLDISEPEQGLQDALRPRLAHWRELFTRLR